GAPALGPHEGAEEVEERPGQDPDAVEPEPFRAPGPRGGEDDDEENVVPRRHGRLQAGDEPREAVPDEVGEPERQGYDDQVLEEAGLLDLALVGHGRARGGGAVMAQP